MATHVAIVLQLLHELANLKIMLSVFFVYLGNYTCHQCRQKIRDLKTTCHNENCSGVRGQVSKMAITILLHMSLFLFTLSRVTLIFSDFSERPCDR